MKRDSFPHFGYIILALQNKQLPVFKRGGKGRSMLGHSVTDYFLTAPISQPGSFHDYSGSTGFRSSSASLFSKRSDSKRTALVVDDVIDVTEMLSVFLTHAGYEVVTAASAPAALAAARSQQFDVVISDIGMPEMNGYDLARALRALPEYQNVPLVAVTGYSMFDDRERSLNSGFNAHMTKPIEPRALLDLIEKL